MTTLPFQRFAIAVIAGAAVVGGLGGCVPLAIGGAAVGTGLVVTDRRTSGIQLDDQTIEVRAGSRLREISNSKMRVSATSYNRQVLLTGAVSSEADKQRIEAEVKKVDNVRSVVNEVRIGTPATLQQQANDTMITGLVKSSLVNTNDLLANIFKVVTESNTVYLMGIATSAELNRATDIVRRTSGVEKVVRVVELVSESDLTRGVAPSDPAKPAPTPAPVVDIGTTPTPPAAPTGAVALPVR